MLTAKSLKKHILSLGADLVGIGSIDRWDNAPPENRPSTIMPNAKSVVCIGMRIHKGSHRGVEEGTYYSSYTLTGFADLNNIIAPTLQRGVASYIEDFGFEAATVMYHANRFGGGHYGVGTPALYPDGTKKPAPDILFNFRIAAVLCGVGEIGISRLLLTPQFGPSQRVYFIITDAKLEPDPIYNGKICDGCRSCVRGCPTKALSGTEFDDVPVPNVTDIHRGAIDVGKCSIGHYGGVSPFASKEVLDWSKNIIEGTSTHLADGIPRPTDEDIVSYLRENVGYTKNAEPFTYGPAVVCANCIRACLYHLEKRGKITGKRMTLKL